MRVKCLLLHLGHYVHPPKEVYLGLSEQSLVMVRNPPSGTKKILVIYNPFILTKKKSKIIL